MIRGGADRLDVSDQSVRPDAGHQASPRAGDSGQVGSAVEQAVVDPPREAEGEESGAAGFAGVDFLWV